MTFLNLIRDTEYRKEVLIFFGMAFAGTIAGFLIKPAAGVLTAVLSVCFLVVHVLFFQRRQQKIAELSDVIDHILHGEETVSVDAHTEGELSILENEIAKMTVRLREQADRLVSEKERLSTAIEDICHQLRTPLTSMSLSVEILRNQSGTEDRRQMALQEIRRSIDRIRWEVESLLKISKIDAGTALFKGDPVSVQALIEQAASSLLIPMELRDQHFTVEVSDEHFTGDLLWSVEALGNLLKNAVEHTPDGGEIHVAAVETPIFTEIVVSDNGPGFEASEIPSLFDRYFRGSNSSGESIGVGLALARMIITAQNGTISASNNPGGGAHFTVRFYKSVV